jgi:hypothetical protein
MIKGKVSGQQRPASKRAGGCAKAKGKRKKEKVRMRSMLFISTFTFCLLDPPETLGRY